MCNLTTTNKLTSKSYLQSDKRHWPIRLRGNFILIKVITINSFLFHYVPHRLIAFISLPHLGLSVYFMIYLRLWHPRNLFKLFKFKTYKNLTFCRGSRQRNVCRQQGTTACCQWRFSDRTRHATAWFVLRRNQYPQHGHRRQQENRFREVGGLFRPLLSFQKRSLGCVERVPSGKSQAGSGGC